MTEAANSGKPAVVDVVTDIEGIAPGVGGVGVFHKETQRNGVKQELFPYLWSSASLCKEICTGN